MKTQDMKRDRATQHKNILFIYLFVCLSCKHNQKIKRKREWQRQAKQVKISFGREDTMCRNADKI